MHMPDDCFPDFNQEIAKFAYLYWEEEGYPQDRAVQHWERAEREMRLRLGNSSVDGQAPGGIANDTGSSGKMG